ncbi:hypothetical protein Bca4012_048609 [Brassica carinata]
MLKHALGKPESHPFPMHPTAEWHVVGGGYSSGLLDIMITQVPFGKFSEYYYFVLEIFWVKITGYADAEKVYSTNAATTPHPEVELLSSSSTCH